LVEPKVSIIIPCKQVGKYAEESIKNCLALDYPHFEILVLPDADWGNGLPKVKSIPTGSVGPAEKRDLAAQYAEGDILAFIDDDAFPDKQWLVNALRHFEKDHVAAVTGPGLTPKHDSILQRASGRIFSSFMGAGVYKFRNSQSGSREIDDAPSCNLLVRKDVFNQLGGFSTEFWPGEDTKLCLDIKEKLRKKIIYDPEVVVYHHRRSLFLPHLKQIWNYALHRGYFAKRYPGNSLKIFYFLPSCMLMGIIAGSLLSFFLPFIRWIFLASLLSYLMLVLLSSVQRTDIRTSPIVFLGIVSTHLTYGAGFIKGLVTRGLAR